MGESGAESRTVMQHQGPQSCRLPLYPLRCLTVDLRFLKFLPLMAGGPTG